MTWAFPGLSVPQQSYLCLLCQVLSKESDVSAFEAHVDGVLNLHWLITHCIVKRVAPPQQPSWNSSLWKGIELLSKLVDQSDSIRKLARDEVRMFVTLTDMLQLDLSPGQICTVLAFLRHLVYGIRIRRVDVTLTTLLTKLLRYDSVELHYHWSLLSCSSVRARVCVYMCVSCT